MTDTNYIDGKQLSKLAVIIRDEVFEKIYSNKTTVFLCGATTKKKKSVRDEIADMLTTESYSYKYDVFYPEVLFDELLLGPLQHDLLKLENILAEGVNVIIIVLESVGAIAELGAFANNIALRNKIICIQDNKHKKAKSFINYGLVKSLKKSKEGKVLNIDYGNVKGDIKKIRDAISEIGKKKVKVINVANAVQTENFILPSIYLLEPVSRTMLIDLVKNASDNDHAVASASTAAALSILSKKKLISLHIDKYQLTPEGLRHFRNLGRHGKTRYYFNFDVMDKVRLDILSWKYRKKLPSLIAI
jgi:hypothetical protein